MLKSKFFTAFT